MFEHIALLAIIIVLAPLAGSIVAGVFGQQIGRRGAHFVAISGVTISFVLSVVIFKWLIFDGLSTFNSTIYTWMASGPFHFTIGFLIDRLSAVMMVVVTSISLLVHIYSVGYMRGDPGNTRFFSYMSFFTFSMLMIVLANNFLQLFFGWEGVGFASYLLIGFWFNKQSAVLGSLKAFLVNRVGDLGFVLGIAAVFSYFGTLDYLQVFAKTPSMIHETIQLLPGVHAQLITVICSLLFIGAMGKSAQMPLHVWLPESMEGPTPISALIHAATMVVAGVFMLTRLSPIFEYSKVTLSFILIIGSTGALFMGLVAIVQNDIKRVIAYSTLSQLGYMIAAIGASAFAAGMFHLVTHAFFKSLLFLAAGSVIIAMGNEQDMRKMGGLYKKIPITYLTFLIGALSLSAIPPFAGFYSKDAIIEAIGYSTITGSAYAYYCVLIGSFVSALYIFRAFFLVFHTQEKMDNQTKKRIKESSWVIWVPLVILAIPAAALGCIMVGPILTKTLFANSIVVLKQYNVMQLVAGNYDGAVNMWLHAFQTAPFWFSVAGVLMAWVCYQAYPELPSVLSRRFSWLYAVLINKYGFDDFNEIVFVKRAKGLGRVLYNFADVKFIDDWCVNRTGRFVTKLSKVARRIQTGYIYHYAFVCVCALLIFMLLV